MIFGSFETIYTMNNSIIQEFKSRIFDRFMSPTVGDIFAKMGPMFSLYEQYSKDFSEAVYYIKRLPKVKEHLFTVIQRLQSENKTAPVISLLEIPCKRLNHYKTLMSELLKCTPEEHLDYIFLKDAIVKVESAILGIKNHELSAKDSQKVREIEDKIDSLPNNILPLAIPGRVFMEESEFYQIDDPKKYKSRNKFLFFVFNDLIIRTKSDKKKCVFVSSFSLQGAFLDDLQSNSNLSKDAFQIKTLDNLYTFAVSDSNTKPSILQTVQKAIETAHLADPKKQLLKRKSIYRTKLECVAALLSQELNYLPKKTVENNQKKKYDEMIEIIHNYEFFSRGIIPLNNQNLSLLSIKLLEANQLFFPLLTKFLRFEVHMVSEQTAVDNLENVLHEGKFSLLCQNLNLVAFSYVQNLMKPFLLEIIDKAPSEQWHYSSNKQATDNILKITESIVNKILSSANTIHSHFKELLKLVKSELEKKFSSNKKISVIGITSSVAWQSFFAPAFNSPQLYHITNQYPNGNFVKDSLQFFSGFLNHVFSGFQFKNISNLQPFNQFITKHHSSVANFVDSLTSSIQFGHNHSSFCLNKEVKQEVLPSLSKQLFENLDPIIDSIKKNQSNNSQKEKKIIDQFINSLATISSQDNFK